MIISMYRNIFIVSLSVFEKCICKCVGIPNCLTIANTSYKNCFQYVGVPLSELITEKALSLATNLSIVLLKLLLTVPAVRVPDLILCIAKFIDERKWCCSYAVLAKKNIICI